MRGVFGGTFDPVHVGHLRCAWEVAEALDMPVHMIPARVPPHRRTPVGSAAQRWAMLKLALAGQSRLLPDDRELKRPGPSYMIDTLASLEAEFQNESLCLVLGQDAACELETWHRWRELLERAHLVVLTRPGGSSAWPEALERILRPRVVSAPAEFKNRTAPAVLRHEVTALDVSASGIRRAWAAGEEPRFLTPRAVHDYIARHRIYG